jgi:M6 family metalloprotease-like protein
MKKNILFSIIILYSLFCWSAPLKNAKIQIKQPNGKVIDCFATGDEFYHWTHDEDNYTIIQDQKTGYYCYAISQNNVLIASKYVVGVDNPAKSGILPGVNLTPDKILDICSNSVLNKQEKPKYIKDSNQESLKSVTTSQTLNNIVVYIRFADQTEFPANQSYYTSLFNSSASGANSMYNYFREASFNNLNIVSSFFPTNNGTIITSYKDSHIRDYYCPFSDQNDSGYIDDNGSISREITLLTNAIQYVKNQIPSSLIIDSNNDGYVDNISFIVRGVESSFLQFPAPLIWPHKMDFGPNRIVYINSKRVGLYIFLTENCLGASGNHTLCHEMFHSLGAPDLFHYSYDYFYSVGPWELMDIPTDIPHSMCAYMKYKYGHWISSIPEITKSGHYTLNPITSSSNNCYRISSSIASEYFVLEFRKKNGTFEGALPGTGLLIYRINSNFEGNSKGTPKNTQDEVYVYRIGGSPSSVGNKDDAYFDSSVGRSTFHNTSNPYCFLSDGSVGNIFIKNIMVSGNTVSFDVRFCNGTNITYSNTNQLPQVTNVNNKIETTASVTVKSTDNITFEAGQEVLLNGFEVQLGGQFLVNMIGCGNQ